MSDKHYNRHKSPERGRSTSRDHQNEKTKPRGKSSPPHHQRSTSRSSSPNKDSKSTKSYKNNDYEESYDDIQISDRYLRDAPPQLADTIKKFFTYQKAQEKGQVGYYYCNALGKCLVPYAVVKEYNSMVKKEQERAQKEEQERKQQEELIKEQRRKEELDARDQKLLTALSIKTSETDKEIREFREALVNLMKHSAAPTTPVTTKTTATPKSKSKPYKTPELSPISLNSDASPESSPEVKLKKKSKKTKSKKTEDSLDLTPDPDYSKDWTTHLTKRIADLKSLKWKLALAEVYEKQLGTKMAPIANNARKATEIKKVAEALKHCQPPSSTKSGSDSE
mmetsp:Transcript_8922/g.12278  ORF Transcript_8922/g.12278 Transcript_8922/m.12278 type:complete len:337 (+) Transcript_8922:331-1341(+)